MQASRLRYSNMTIAEQLSNAFKAACMAELEALKPGNVHIFADGHGMTVQDFIASADAVSKVIALPYLSLGERILHSVQATQNAVNMNTNLGMILLCAPIIQAKLLANKEGQQPQGLSPQNIPAEAGYSYVKPNSHAVLVYVPQSSILQIGRASCRERV